MLPTSLPQNDYQLFHSPILDRLAFVLVLSSFVLHAFSQSNKESSLLAWSADVSSLKDKSGSQATSQFPNASSVFLPGNLNIECNGRQYGRPNPTSCLNAWLLMPPTDRVVTFADRSQEIASEVVLPWRFPSHDAKCVIEVGQETLAGRDSASPLELKVAAFDVFKQCIKGPRSNLQGGIAQHLGDDGNLAVVVKTYEPNVECIEPQDPGIGLVTCQRTLNKLSTSKEVDYFGGSDASGADVRLPKEISVDPSKCIISIETMTTLQRARWYDIWSAATAIVGKCVRTGKWGIARGLGTSGKIMVRVFSEESVVAGEISTS